MKPLRVESKEQSSGVLHIKSKTRSALILHEPGIRITHGSKKLMHHAGVNGLRPCTLPASRPFGIPTEAGAQLSACSDNRAFTAFESAPTMAPISAVKDLVLKRPMPRVCNGGKLAIALPNFRGHSASSTSAKGPWFSGAEFVGRSSIADSRLKF